MAKFLRIIHIILSDLPFLKIPARFIRNFLIGKKRSWGWKIRDLAADFSHPASLLGEGIEIRIAKSGTYLKAIDGLEYHFDFSLRHSIPIDLLRGVQVVDVARFKYLVNFLPKDSIIIDAGAGVGEYSMNLAILGFKVYAFEPMSLSFQRLVKNIKRNGLEKNIICNQLAVWDKTGEFGLTAIDEDDNRLVSVSSENSIEKIRATRLEEYLVKNKIKKIDCIVADVQGAEFQLVRGLGGFMDSRPLLMLEIVPRTARKMGYEYGELFEYLIKLGYKYTGIHDSGEVSQDHYSKQIPKFKIFLFSAANQAFDVIA